MALVASGGNITRAQLASLLSADHTPDPVLPWVELPVVRHPRPSSDQRSHRRGGHPAANLRDLIGRGSRDRPRSATDLDLRRREEVGLQRIPLTPCINPRIIPTGRCERSP